MGCIQSSSAAAKPPTDLSEKPPQPVSPTAATATVEVEKKEPQKQETPKKEQPQQAPAEKQEAKVDVTVTTESPETKTPPESASTPKAAPAAIKEAASVGHKRQVSGQVSYDGDRAVDNRRAEAAVSMAINAIKRRGDVFVEHIEAKDRYSLAMIPKSEEQMSIIQEALAGNVLFNGLGEVEKAMVIGTMKSVTCEEGEALNKQGESEDSFFVIESGSFDVLVDGKKTEEKKKGSCFGELALVYNSPRTATVVAKEKGKLWTLNRDTYRKIISSTANKAMHEVQKALKSVPLLQGLSDEQITQLCDIVALITFKEGDVIIRKGDEGSVFYFIKSGSVQCTKIGKQEADLELGPGDYFGERSLMKSEPRAANVIALTETELIALEKADFERHLGSLLETLDKNLGIRVLKVLPIFKDFSTNERNAVVDEFKMKDFNDGEYIVRQGENGSTFYIIREGAAEVSKKVEGADTKAVIATLGQGDYFGEGALLRDEPRGADVVAKGPVKTFELDRESFDRHMNKLKAKLTSHHTKRLDETADAVKKVRRGLEEQIKFSELVQIRTLGTGTFGRVKLVEHKKLKMAFALKILQKAQIVAYKQQTNVVNEKDVMIECDHPFILRLFKTFKDKNCLYLLLEFVQGGELFSLLHVRGGKLGDKDARFYAGCVLDALEYLHDRTIVYRDLKPENLMIDDVGYIRVVDFGFAKKIADKSYTLCGTPEYLAPELVLGKGHNKGVDYWALGILIFEMITGGSPFADQENGDQMVICKNIVRGKAEFGRKYPEKAKDLTIQLLVREPHLRLGCLKNGAKDIKDHAWFKGFDFTDLYRKRIKAPWVPEIKSPTDASNFEVYDEDDHVEPYNDRTGGNWDASF